MVAVLGSLDTCPTCVSPPALGSRMEREGRPLPVSVALSDSTLMEKAPRGLIGATFSHLQP